MDPFDRSNPLGPQGTLGAYRSALTGVEAGRTYSDLVATQQVLDLSGIDAGLAVTVAAHQEALRRQALEFDETVQADYIQLVGDVDNLLSLLSAVETVNGAPNPSSHRWWQDVSAEVMRGHEAYRDIMIHLYSKLRRAGDGNVHFVDGEALIPFNVHGAYTDGGHPSDHGFQMMAERLAPFVQRILLADPVRC